MSGPPTIDRVLTGHFFRRFFDSDTVKVEGETLTTIIRAISTVAMPGLVVAFFLQNSYPQRSLWGAIEDQYFFVLFSFVVMGGAAIFEWDMLFPDRLDFLVLSPLPIRPMQMLRTKAAALAAFLALFLVSSNLLGALVLPLMSKGNVLRHVYAHTAAVMLAGLFAALSCLALGGMLLCLLGAARFRAISPVIRIFAVTALLLLMIHYGKAGDSLQWWLHDASGWTRWLPPIWFLGLYQVLLRGAAAPSFAWPMAGYAIRATLLVGAIVVLTYPLAWARMRRMAIEGTSVQRNQPSRWRQALSNRLVRQPAGRASFYFIGQTLARSNRYQVYLAMYAGTGLALAIACAVSLQMQGSVTRSVLSLQGLHAVMPLLLFWLVAGLRSAFAFPVDLAAGWVFRVSGVDCHRCAAAGRTWALVLSSLVIILVLAVLALAGWQTRALLVQAVCGISLAILLTDGFFFLQRRVPFNQARMPGRRSLPLLLTLYIGVFPPFIVGVVHLEKLLEMSLFKLISLVAGVLLIHAGMHFLRSAPLEVEEEMEPYEGEFQLLGLSFE
jgi:hypothetical protein